MSNDKYEKGARQERKIASMLRAENWFVSRSAGSGTAEGPSVDLVAMKDGTVLLIECKVVPSKSFSLRFSKDTRQVEEIVRMIGPSYIEEADTIDFRFLLAVKPEGERFSRFLPFRSGFTGTYNQGETLKRACGDKESEYDYGVGVE